MASRGLAAFSSVLRLRVLARFQAKLQARTAANFKLRLALLLLLSVVNVAIGAVLYKLCSDEDWGSAAFTVYAVLYNVPGSDITSAPTLLATVVLQVIFIFGLLVFATILAMISEEVNTMLLTARSGKAPLQIFDHILILNWNNQVAFILEQLEEVQLAGGKHTFANRPVVILADHDREEMDSLVHSTLKSSRALEVHTRSGKPWKLEALQRVSAADAAAVLVLHPSEEAASEVASEGADDAGSAAGDAAAEADGAGSSTGANALKMQTIMALSSQVLGSRAHIVVQVPETSSGRDGDDCQLQLLDQVLVMAGHSSPLLKLPVRRMVNSLAVQTAIQPGSALIYHRILHQGLAPNLIFQPLPAVLLHPTCKSITYADVRESCGSDALVVGYVCSKDQQLVLNPSDDALLARGDNLLVLRHAEAPSKPGLAHFLQGVLAGAMWHKQPQPQAQAQVPAAHAAAAQPDSAAATVEPPAAAPAKAGQQAVAADESEPAAAPNPDSSTSLGANEQEQLLAVIQEADKDAALGTSASGKPAPASCDAAVVAAARPAAHALPLSVADAPAAGPAVKGSREADLRPLAARAKPGKKKKKLALRKLFCLGDSGDAGAAKPAGGLLKNASSFVADATKGVGNVAVAGVGAMAGAVTTVTGAVANVAEGAATLSKTVVTGAVNTVADGAIAISKGAVNAVTSVADTVSTAVSQTAGAITCSSSMSKAAVPLPAAAQRTAWPSPTWLFGGGRMAPSARQLAAMRLAQLSGSSKRPTRPLKVIAAGFAADEAADLLPLFSDFAPAGSSLTLIIGKGQQTPDGLEAEGVLEGQAEEEQQQGSLPSRRFVRYRFMPHARPLSSSGLAAAGVVNADAVLLSAEPAVRGSPAEGDAQVLGGLLGLQHLLALHKQEQEAKEKELEQQRRQRQQQESSSSRPSLLASKTFGRITSIAKPLGGALSNGGQAAASSGASSGRCCVSAADTEPARRLHVVACVASTSCTSVAAAFFGPPGGAAAPVAGDGGGGAVLPSTAFSYELLVPGELEAALLVNVAKEPLYVQVVAELLGSSDGCELYLLEPRALGFAASQSARWAEVAETARLLGKTALGLVAGGRLRLAPAGGWQWRVRAADRVVVIADSW